MPKKIIQKYKNEVVCVHHWIIEPASGGASNGKCRKCKLVKKFSNSGWEYGKTSWGNSTSKNNREEQL